MKGITGIATRLGLTRSPWLRHIVLGVLARVGQRDVTIAHHWVPGRKVHLHRFRHKGYWFYGRAREEDVMRAFAALIGKADTVIELGGHIGYISVYLASLVGPAGRVFVFEPSPETLPYTKRNIANDPAITLVEQAASDKAGTATFFIERLTGQNSTLVENYSVFTGNRERAFSDESYEAIEVRTTTIDDFVKANGVDPNFIKIDVEGAELAALRGSIETLTRCRPRLMIEVTNEREAVFALMIDLGYRIYDDAFHSVEPSGAPPPNLFFIHRDDPLPLR